MAEYLFKGDSENKSGYVKVRLIIFHFKDENNIHFIYSPQMDLTGYGNNLEEAKGSFKIVFSDFVDYTLKKKTIGKVLSNLGWELKGTIKNPKKILAPSITTVIGNNKYVSEIFDKYSVNTYHEEVGIPTYA